MSSAIDEVQHPIIREAIKILGFKTPQVEITTLADIPVRHRARLIRQLHHRALESALRASACARSSPRNWRELACEIEIDRLGEPIGKQDQYIAACGGVDLLHVSSRRPRRRRAAGDLDGYQIRSRRQSVAVLHRLFAQRRIDPEGSEYQDQGRDKEMIDNLHFVKELGLRGKTMLEAGKT